MQVGPKLSKAGPTLVNAANVTEIASNGERPIAAIVNVPKPANRKNISKKTCTVFKVACGRIFLSSLTEETSRGCNVLFRLAKQL